MPKLETLSKQSTISLSNLPRENTSFLYIQFQTNRLKNGKDPTNLELSAV